MGCLLYEPGHSTEIIHLEDLAQQEVMNNLPTLPVERGNHVLSSYCSILYRWSRLLFYNVVIQVVALWVHMKSL